MRDYLLTPPDIRALLRTNLRLLPFNAAMAVFCLLYHFHIGGTPS